MQSTTAGLQKKLPKQGIINIILDYINRMLGSITKSLKGNFLGHGINTGARLLLTILLARTLTPQEFGIYSLVIVSINAATLLTSEGTARLIEREISGSLGKEKTSTINAIFNFCKHTSPTITLICGIFLGAFVYLNGVFSDKLITYIPLITGLFILETLNSHIRGVLRGLGKTSICNYPPLIITLGLTFYCILFQNNDYETNVITILVLRILLTLVSSTAWIFLYSKSGAKLKELKKPKQQNNQNTNWLKEGLQFSFIALIQIALVEFITIFLSFYSTTYEIAQYRVATRFFLLSNLGLSVTLMAFTPYIAYYAKSNKWNTLQQNAQLISIVGIGFSIGIFTGLLLFGESIIAIIFGKSYSSAFMPSLILSFAAVINAIFGPSARVLKMCGKQNGVIKGIIIGGLASIATSLILVPLNPLIGGSTAVLIGTLSTNLIYHFEVKTQLAISTIPSQLSVRYFIKHSFKVIKHSTKQTR